MVTKILLVAFLVSISVGVVVCRSVTSTQVHTVAEVLTWDRGGTVALDGIITYADENHFVMDDGSGKVELSTCPVWYKRIRVYEKDHIMVIGQISNNPSYFKNCNIMLNVYKIIKNGDTINIREHPGIPPWVSKSPS